MNHPFPKTRIALAALAALGTLGMALSATSIVAAEKGGAEKSEGKRVGQYAAGDFHNHTTCSDGSISMQKLVKKATGKGNDGWGLDWFVQAGHGGNGNRNCTLVEDETLSTPVYPVITGKGPTTTWADSVGVANVKGNLSGTAANPNMWRWQSLQEYQYPLIEYLSAAKGVPLFVGLESVVAGHEHSSMSVITGQMPETFDQAALPTGPGPLTARYTPLGNATALAQWSYCFDRGDTDTSRGNSLLTNTGNNWNCAVAGSDSAADASWNAAAQKLIPATGAGVGDRGHKKTVEAVKWMAQNHANGSYYVPAHLERAGPFNPNGNNGYNIEHLRNFNNAGPNVAFGFETQPGHGASSERGEYYPKRNNFNPGVVPPPPLVDSVGGTTYGGTGVYGAQVGGVWDALLGEGRNFWFFASSDWHNRGSFGPDDRRSTQDFQPGEYQRNYTMVRSADEHDARLRPQAIVDGLRTGNNWAASGQLIDRLAFVACASNKGGSGFRPDASVEAHAVNAVVNNTDVDTPRCATMGEKLVVKPGSEIVVTVVVRDPAGTNNSPYSFPNPSLLQVGIHQPMNAPVLDHIDLIRGKVSGYRKPGAADYAGEWPRDWLKADGSTAPLTAAPAATRNLTAAVIKTFGSTGASRWQTVYSSVDNSALLKMTYRIPPVTESQYVRLRGTNMPPLVPFETDANGNPLSDLHTNATTTVSDAVATATKPASAGTLKLQCTTKVGSNVPANGVPYVAGSAPIDACPNHLPTVKGVKYVAYDVAAWADLWFYSNPIFIEVEGSTAVAGVQ